MPRIRPSRSPASRSGNVGRYRFWPPSFICSAKHAPATRAVMAMFFPVSIKGVLLEAGRAVLLENERCEWELPGGRLQAGEDPAICLACEFAEELGIKV